MTTDRTRDTRAALLILALGAATLAAAAALYAQPAAPSLGAQPAAPPMIDSTLARALVGRWHCAGAFASGRPIEAEIAVTSELDGRALLVRHDDRPPQRWRALALWRADTSGAIAVTLHDDAGPPRTFAAAPWDGGTVRLVSTAPGPRRERFTYARTPAGFDMTYEVATDGTTWRLGDRLGCASM